MDYNSLKINSVCTCAQGQHKFYSNNQVDKHSYGSIDLSQTIFSLNSTASYKQ